MTEPYAGTSNTAEDGASVGIQAEEVNGSTVYMNSTVYLESPDDSPQQKYGIGVSYLAAGVPGRARDLIGEAIARDYENGEVRFHWTLAMLSKRSYRDLSAVERSQLAETADRLPGYADDEWRRGLEAICDLLDCLRSRNDPGLAFALKKLDNLRPHQRDKIDRHLDLVLTGGMKDSRWTDTLQRAVADREYGNRSGRIWAYFQADPAKPRAQWPAIESTTVHDRYMAGVWSSLFAIVAGYLGWTAIALGSLLPTLAFSITLIAGYVAAANGLLWRYRAERLKAKERDHAEPEDGEAAPEDGEAAPEDGFANGVDAAFSYYFAKYVPHEVEQEAWLAATAGIRRTLREEIVEIYREQRTSAAQVRWLIRYLVGDVRRRWTAGTLWEYRQQYRVALSTKVKCAAALVIFVFTAVTVVGAELPAHPITALLTAGFAIKSGHAAAIRWRDIISERWRVNDEGQEYGRVFAERQEAYERWKAKLDAARPSESEMEYWLYCDKTILLGKALRHYQLAWRDLIAHAFLQVPAKRYKRGRVKGGPWRYSRYEIRLFLVTKDGVREVSSELDFEHASFHGEDRTNFRFEAVSSVRVTETGSFSNVLEMVLTNGPARSIRITEPEARQEDSDEDPVVLARMNLETTGFTHALHILEGIAAEGSGWIDRDPYTNGDLDDFPR